MVVALTVLRPRPASTTHDRRTAKPQATACAENA
jgi:hypothetical protein